MGFRIIVFSILLSLATCKIEATPYFSDRFLVAGNGEAGFIDGMPSEARLNKPSGLVVTQDGKTLYFCDEGNNSIRKIALDSGFKVSTLAGNGEIGFSDGVSISARLAGPTQLHLSPDEKKLIFLDSGNSAIRLYDVGTQMVSTVARSLSVGQQYSSFVWSWDKSGGYVLCKGQGEILALDSNGNTKSYFSGDNSAGELFENFGRFYFYSPSGKFAELISTNFGKIPEFHSLEKKCFLWGLGPRNVWLFFRKQEKFSCLLKMGAY
jgi:DNA-binding beta-propeller fold protein YncE